MADGREKLNMHSTELEEVKNGIAISSDGETRTKKNAAEREAMLAYSVEYRQKLMSQEKRRAAEERKKRLEADKEAESEKKEARRREIEEFMARERAEAEVREAEASALLARISGQCAEALEAVSDQENASHIKCENNGAAEVVEPEIQKNEKEEIDTPEALEPKDEKNEVSEPTDDGEGITLNAGKTSDKEENKILLHISAENTDNAVLKKTKKPKRALIKEDMNRELRVAEIKHRALVALAMQSAEDYDVDESALLDKEQARYNAELDEIRARAHEHTEIRESITLAADFNECADRELSINIPAAAVLVERAAVEDVAGISGDSSAQHEKTDSQPTIARRASTVNRIPLAFGITGAGTSGYGANDRTRRAEAAPSSDSYNRYPLIEEYPEADSYRPLRDYPETDYYNSLQEYPLLEGYNEAAEYPFLESYYEAEYPLYENHLSGAVYPNDEVYSELDDYPISRGYTEYRSPVEDGYNGFEDSAEKLVDDSIEDALLYGSALYERSAAIAEQSADEVDSYEYRRDVESERLLSREGYADPPQERLWLDEEDMHYGIEEYGRKNDVSEAYSQKTVRRSADSDVYEIEVANMRHDMQLEHINKYQSDSVAAFARFELSKRLERYVKDERNELKKLARIESRQKGAVHEMNVLLIIEKIGVQKNICELAIEALYACVYANSKGKINRYRRNLISHIDRYNSFCEEYETATGKPLEHLSHEMAEDIMTGRICAPIPNVYYYGEEDNGRYNLAAAEAEHMHRTEQEDGLVEGEYLKFVEEDREVEYTRAEARVHQKKQAERMSAIRRASERDILLVELRNEYKLSSLISERDMLMNFYGTDKRKMAKRTHALDEKIHKMKTAGSRAVSLERQDNSRYYLLSALDPSKEKISKRARRERLDALRMRLEVLLSEREDINERLIALYGGADKKLTATKINRKAEAVRRKSAKSMYKRQRDVAEKIERARVSSDMKRCAYELLNKKTAAAATFDECYFKLRRTRPSGRAKKELLNNMNRAKAEIKNANRELKYILKRFKRYEKNREADKEWAILLITLAALSILGLGAWYLWGDNVISYFADLASKFKR